MSPIFTRLFFVVTSLCAVFTASANEELNQLLGDLVYDKTKEYPAKSAVMISVDDGEIYTSKILVPAAADGSNGPNGVNSATYWGDSTTTTTQFASDNPNFPSELPTDVDTAELSKEVGALTNPGITGGRLINLSTRGFVGTGERRMVGGFKVYGADLDIIIRGFGPSHNLTNKALDDPRLTWKTAPTSLKADTDGIISEVDNYDQNSRLSGVNELAQSKIDNLIAKETADIQTASNWSNERSNGYTAFIDAKTDAEAGVGRIGINDLTDFTGDGQLVNISTRGYVGNHDDHYLVAGFNIRGGSVQVCIRAFGPSMNLAGEQSLVDPILEIIQQKSDYHDEKKVIYMNDNWKSDFIGTSDITPFNITSQKSTVPYYLNNKLLDNEAAVVITLESGNYTARVYGKNGGTGIGRVGIDKIVDEWNVSE
jgi:hypothetical protein